LVRLRTTHLFLGDIKATHMRCFLFLNEKSVTYFFIYRRMSILIKKMNNENTKPN